MTAIGVDIPGTLLLDPAVIEDPYPFYDRLRVEAPFWHVPGTAVFAATSFEVVAEIVGRTEDFSNNVRCVLYRDESGLPQQLPLGDMVDVQALASADPPVHTLHRKTVFPELVARRMATLKPEIEDLAGGLIEKYLRNGGGDFMAEVGNQVPINMIARLIGFRANDPARLLKAAFDSTMMIGATGTLDDLMALVAQSEDIQAWITEEIEAPGAPDDVLLGTISQGVRAGDLSLHEGAIILHTLLSAGGESTTSLLGNSVRLLAERSDIQDRLRSDHNLVPLFIEEVLRLESPFRMQMRSVPANTSIVGVEVPAGSTVCVFFSAANRDRAEFEQADDVRLDRESPKYHLAFGRGIHHCVGAPLARLKAEVVITTLLEATSSVTLDPGSAPVRVSSLLVRRHESLPLTVT